MNEIKNKQENGAYCSYCQAPLSNSRLLYCSHCGASTSPSVAEVDALSKRIFWGTALLSLGVSGTLFFVGGYLAALAGMVVTVSWLAPRLFKPKNIRYHYDQHVLNVSTWIITSILLSCSVCVGGPLYVGAEFGIRAGLIALCCVLLMTGILALLPRIIGKFL